MRDNRYCLGIDIGGTKTAAAIVAPSGDLAGYTEVATPCRDGPTAVTKAAVIAARSALAGTSQPVSCCGVGTAGTVSAEGVITHATSAIPGWTGTDVAAALSGALAMPVTVLNDVHAAALGEAAIGHAAHVRDALIVAVGTGIGGGVIHDGQLLRGASGSAGSIGHIPVAAGVRQPCTCGAWDHLEAHAAGPAIERQYAAVSGQPLALRDIAALARTSGGSALAVIQEAGAILGRALGAAANLLDPEVIIITGGVAALRELLEAPVLEGVASAALPGPNQLGLRFSELGPRGAIVGAAVAARTLVASAPAH